MCTLKSPQILIRTHQKNSHIKESTKGRTTRTAQKRTNRENFPHIATQKKHRKCWGFNNTKQLTKQLNKQVPKLQRCTPACKHRTNNFPYRFVCCRMGWQGRRKSTQWVQTSIFRVWMVVVEARVIILR